MGKLYGVAAGILALTLTVGTAVADDFQKDGLKISEPWARASAGPAKAGAAYLTIENTGEASDTLVGVESTVAKRTEVHNHIMDGGVMLMRKVEGVEVAPGTPMVFQPGGLHVMFMGLKRPLKEGETIGVTLVFEKAGKLDIEVAVQDVGAKGPGMKHDHMNHDHSGHGHMKHKVPTN